MHGGEQALGTHPQEPLYYLAWPQLSLPFETVQGFFSDADDTPGFGASVSGGFGFLLRTEAACCEPAVVGTGAAPAAGLEALPAGGARVSGTGVPCVGWPGAR